MSEGEDNTIRKGEFEIPPGSRERKCQSCGMGVVWITTAKGAAMPLSIATKRTLPNGLNVALSHFSDCPQGKGWSKRGKQ